MLTSKKIKVLVDAHVFDSSYQGTTTYLKGLYGALVNDEDFEITLMACNIKGLKEKFGDTKFNYIQLPSGSKIKRLAYDIPKIIAINKFDYAHFQYITPLKKECRYINTIHDVLFLDFPQYFPTLYKIKNKFLFGKSAGHSDVICTVSEYSKSALIKNFSLKPQNIIITPNAVTIPINRSINVASKFPHNKYLLYVSRFEPRKNHYALLKAFVELELFKQGYKLVFVGRIKDISVPDYSSYFNKLSPEVKQYVVLYENLTDEELTYLYQNASLFVYPSFAEGFGIPPLEAAINNCKVLCSNQTAMSDFSFFGKYLFDPYNEEMLKEKITEVLNDEGYPFEKMNRAVREKYNWKNVAITFGNHLKELL